MGGENYFHWHDGVEFDRESNTWRGYIEDNDYTRKVMGDDTFAEKGDAVKAAGEMLAQARHGNPPG